jgi:hypothetical protein
MNGRNALLMGQTRDAIHSFIEYFIFLTRISIFNQIIFEFVNNFWSFLKNENLIVF